MCLWICNFHKNHVVIEHLTANMPQKIHRMPVPRIGGVGIYLAMLTPYLFVSDHRYEYIILLLGSAFPAFAMGLGEDLTSKVSWAYRLVGTIISAIIFCLVTDNLIKSVGISTIDSFLSYGNGFLIISVLAMAGLTNAFNMVDGLNGLAAGTSIIIISAVCVMADQQGDELLTYIGLVTISGIAGFSIVNYPFGKIFLGDGGAYLIGFITAALLIMLPARNEALSPWVSALLASYPTYETVFTIYRRWRIQHSPWLPDGTHLHTIVYRLASMRWSNSLYSPNIINSISSLFVLVFPLLSAIFTIIFSDNQTALLIGAPLFFLLYLVTYWRINKSTFASDRRVFS